MDFPFYVIDLRADFAARVVDNFVSEYLAGRTPNPCVMCNREIKFDRLWSRARALEADYVATGHYARIEQGADGRFHLLRAADDAEGSVVFSVHPRAGRTRANDFSAGRDDQDRSSRPRTRAGARHRGQAREPGNLLRARRRLCEFCRAAKRPRATPPGLDHRRRREAARAITPGCIDLPSDSAAAWVSPAASGCTCARFGPRRARSWLGARDELDSSGLDRESSQPGR